VLHPGEFPVLALFGHSPFIRRAYSAFRSRSTLRSAVTTSTGAISTTSSISAGQHAIAVLVSVLRYVSSGHSSSARVWASPAMVHTRTCPRSRTVGQGRSCRTWRRHGGRCCHRTNRHAKSAALGSHGSVAAAARSHDMAFSAILLGCRDAVLQREAVVQRQNDGGELHGEARRSRGSRHRRWVSSESATGSTEARSCARWQAVAAR
jgi:hypothetical protein